MAPSNPISVFLNRILAGDGAYLVAQSKALERPLDELSFWAVFLARPIRQLARERYLAKFDSSDWHLGFCPVCGLWPRMARLDSESGRRSLWCVGCDGQWHFPRMVCPFCLEKEQTKLGFITVEDWDGYRIQTCESCHRYLKTRDERQTNAIIAGSLEVEYLTSSTLDAAAAQEKYVSDFVGFTAFDKNDSDAVQKYKSKALNI
jgi:FdhE protein